MYLCLSADKTVNARLEGKRESRINSSAQDVIVSWDQLSSFWCLLGINHDKLTRSCFFLCRLQIPTIDAILFTRDAGC